MLKRAIVVGASSGIGAALVRRLAHSGYKVAAVARRGEALDALCAQLNGEGLPGCTGYVSLDLSFVLASQSGVCDWTIPIPNNPSITGFQFFVQGFVLDPGVNPAGLVASNAGAAVVGTH